MIGRVCPVHGEYSASGVCRWCEPGEKYSLKSVDAVTHQSFIDRTNQAIADLLGPPPKPLPESYALRAIQLSEARLAASRFSYDVLMLKHWHSELAVVEESRLALEHAALRWERVARRWGSKHPTMLDLANGWGRFVVEAMREHVEKLARSNPLLQDKPKEPAP